MANEYRDTLHDIEQIIQEFKQKHNISVGPLDDLLKRLSKHSENVGKVEESIEEIKEEVIEPIKSELNYSNKAGRFSIFGFYVGSVGLIVSIAAIIFTVIAGQGKWYKPDNSTKDANTPTKPGDRHEQMENMTTSASCKCLSKRELVQYCSGISNLMQFALQEQLGGDVKYKTQKNEVLVSLYDSVKMLDAKKHKYYLKPFTIREIKNKESGQFIPIAGIQVLQDGRVIGRTGLMEMIKIKRSNTSESIILSAENHLSSSELLLCVGDEITFFDRYTYRVKRIFRKESKILPVADFESGLLLTLVK